MGTSSSELTNFGINVVICLPVYVSHPSLYPVITRCFDSLKMYYPNMQIISFDDASPLPPMTQWLLTGLNEKNLGFTANVNKHLAAAFDQPFTGVAVVANDDLTFKAGDLDRFKTLTGLQIASPADTASSPDNRFGSIWGITREAYELLGPLDETYRNFYSDRDYYDRALENGVEVVKWPDIVVDHIESATYKTLDKKALLAQDEEKYKERHG